MPPKPKTRSTRSSASSHHQQQAPSASAPSSVVAAPTVEGLPDIALALIVEHLNDTSLIKGLQLANRWAFSYFKGEIQEVAIWTFQILKEDPPRSTSLDDEEKWVVKYAPRLGSFLSRFPNLAILKADHGDYHIAALFEELFQRQTFPTVKRVQKIYKENGSDLYRGSASLMMTALPGLEAIHLMTPCDYKGADAVLKGLADGTTFPRLQELYLEEFNSEFFNPMSRQKSILHRLTEYLTAREVALGTACPALTSLRIKSNFSGNEPSDSAQAMRELLALPSCSKLRHLSVEIICSTEAYVDLMASYIRRTDSLESFEVTLMGRAAEHFGALAAMLINEKPPSLTKFKGIHFEPDHIAELSKLVEAGGLPNLEELHLLWWVDGLGEDQRMSAILVVLTHGVLAPLLTSFTVDSEAVNDNQMGALVAFLQAVVNGKFPKLRNLDIQGLGDEGAQQFLLMLRDAGVNSGAARSLRELSISLVSHSYYFGEEEEEEEEEDQDTHTHTHSIDFNDEESFQELKRLLPNTSVRRSPR